MAKRNKVFEGHYTDSGDAENWTDSPLKDSKLVKGPLLSGDYPQPKFVDYSGGKSARNNPKAEQFLHGDDPDPTPKAS